MNYYEKFIDEYREISKSGAKKKILIHACCGACSIYPLIFLTYLFDITILFTNSNIYPKEEYNLRFEAVKKHVEFINKTFKTDMKVVLDEYDYDLFRINLLPFKDQKEGQERCKICIYKRMKRLFDYANNFGFFYVSTIMSISRNKDVNYISICGENLEKEYPKIKFIHFDFKKNDGQDIGIEIGKEEKIYRQDYCGCEFSK